MKRPELILVVDEDDVALRIVSFCLQDEGFQVTEARSAPEAFRIAREEHVDAIITDTGLHELDGYELCRKFRSDWATRHIPVILKTSSGGPNDRTEGFLSGADDVLIPPYTMKELILRLHRLLFSAGGYGRLHPVTKLPGSQAIRAYIEEVCLGAQERAWALLEIDVNYFRAYNRAFGFEAGDQVLKMVGNLLRKIIYARSDNRAFVGHDGSARFVAVVAREGFEAISSELILQFNAEIRKFYPADQHGSLYQSFTDRKGNVIQVPRMALSIGVITGDLCEDLKYLELREAGVEVLGKVKSEHTSSVFVNRRHLTRRDFASLEIK